MEAWICSPTHAKPRWTRISEPKSYITHNSLVIQPIGSVLKEYLRYAIDSRDLSSVITGTSQPQITVQNLNELVVPIAPLPEQRRIVAKLEALLSKVSRTQQRLSHLPTLLKRFRQSVLAAACSGKLTADWREENADTEPSTLLISRIEKERAKAVSCESVVKLANEDSPTDLIPETWSWVRFGSVISELRNGISIRPNVNPPGTPILRISAARPGDVDLTDVRFMPDSNRFIPLYTLCNGDLLFTRYNGSLELLGVCGMVRSLGERTVLYPDKLMRVRFDHGLVMPSYAEIFFQVFEVHERIIAKSKSSAGQNGVSGLDIKNQPFALPPLAEQQKIVRRVEKLFAFADRIEARLKQAQSQVDRLTQSILAKAFRGELVPTEAELARREGRSYESAGELLERIHATKTVAAPTISKRKQPRSP